MSMTPMCDTHTHTILSDGAYCPAELIRRAQMKGYTLFAITDHVDASNIDLIIPRLVAAAEMENRLKHITIVPGAELTHVRPEHIGELTKRARQLGAKLVLCHGETLAEPVEPGTNRAAIDAGVDILAHPGLISEADVKRAAERNVALEITAKRGHCYTNGHVAKLAKQFGARCTFGTDGHDADQLQTRENAILIMRGCGMTEAEAEAVLQASEQLLRARDMSNDAQYDAV